jgi:hypothetical protein
VVHIGEKTEGFGERKGHLEDLGVVGRILMWILKKSDRLEDLDIKGCMKLKVI